MLEVLQNVSTTKLLRRRGLLQRAHQRAWGIQTHRAHQSETNEEEEEEEEEVTVRTETQTRNFSIPSTVIVLTTPPRLAKWKMRSKTQKD